MAPRTFDNDPSPAPSVAQPAAPAAPTVGRAHVPVPAQDERPPYDVASGRLSYQLPRLGEDTLGTDPIALFGGWLQAAAEAGVGEPNACVLSTADADGRPRGRTVLMRGFTDGFRFFTNYESAKGAHLAANSYASMCFPWLAIHRQVIVSGPVRRLDAADSDAYFASRPPESQIASALSPQSQVLTSIDGLLAELEATLRAHPEGVQRPAHWGGYRLDPEIVEFWQGNVGRLHDRFRFRREGAGWVRERLAP